MTSPPPLFLSLLPDDVLRCDIFVCCHLEDLSSLDQALTTRTYRRLFLNALHSFKYSEFIDVTSKEMAQWLVSRGVTLKRLKVTGTACRELSLIMTHNSSVTHLDLSACTNVLCPDDLVVLSHCYHSLSYINLSGCDLSDYIVEQLLSNNSHLQAINVSECSSFTDHMLGLLGRLAPSLRCLDVSYCTAITDEGLSLFEMSSDESAFAQLKAEDACSYAIRTPPPLRPLCELSLAQCHRITGKGLMTLLPRCRSLTSLDLGYCAGLSDESLYKATQECCLLNRLALTNCHQLSESCLYAIATHCASLVALDIFNCSDMTTNASLVALAMGCPLLESLNMYNCQQISNDGLSILAQNCLHLKQLNISSCVLINDSGLDSLGQYCKQLRSLDLSYCNKVTNRGVDELRRSCVLLKSINLFKCQNVRNLDLVALYSS